MPLMTSSRAVAIISRHMSTRSAGVLRIIASNNRRLISGGVSFTVKPVLAYLSGSMRLTWLFSKIEEACATP